MKSSILAHTNSAGNRQRGTSRMALKSRISKPAWDWTDVPSIDNASLVTTVGTTTPLSLPLATSSSANWQKSAKGESRTMAFVVCLMGGGATAPQRVSGRRLLA